MQKVMVTGGAGFIGSNFVRYLLGEQPDVQIINLDALTYAGSLENLRNLPDPQRHTFVHGDICDRRLIDQIIHENRQAWIVDRILPLEQVRFHHISTDEVFGSLKPDEAAFSETTQYAPNSPYAASKASSDHLVRAYHHTFGLPVSITNCSNNYGPYQFPEKLIPLMILNATRGINLPVYGDGQQIRDWLYVSDHCEAIWRVIEDGQPGETYNVGGNNQPANLTVVHTLCDFLDDLMPDSDFVPHKSLIQYVADRPGHDRRYAMDINKIRNELGWQPRESIESGLLKTVTWYLENPAWVAAVHQHQDYQGWLQKNYSGRGTLA
jgi:dTDP-glucose 4,6-dehydratase